MLLRSQCADGVDLLSVSGPVARDEARSLVDAVAQSLEASPRAVVLDLGSATLAEGASDALTGLGALPSGWPRSALVVCPACTDLPPPLLAADTQDALARIAERAERRCTRIDVQAGPQGPAQARAEVQARAEALGLGDLLDDVQLVVSELVTNAVRHALPPVALEVETDGTQVVIAVCDASPVQPLPRDADEAAEGGRGMLLVDLLCDSHGVRSQPPGKTVWARVLRRDA